MLAARAFATNKSTTDTSILKGSLSAGGYGPDQARFEEPKMQECVKVLRAAGVKTPSPDESGSDVSNQPYQAAFQACPDVALIKAWLQAAGKNLNYGTLQSAIDGLKVTIPGDPTERTYGPPPDADGNPTVYFFNWDEATKNFVIARTSSRRRSSRHHAGSANVLRSRNSSSPAAPISRPIPDCL